MQRNVTEMCQTFRETLYYMKLRSGLNWLREGSKGGLQGHLRGLDGRGEILDRMNIPELLREQPSPFDRAFVCARARVRMYVSDHVS